MNKYSLNIDFSSPHIAPIKPWLDALPAEVPLRCVAPKHNATEAKTLQSLIASNPSVQGTYIEALLWLKLGRLDPAHEFVQDDTQGLGAYIHGFLHRMEGDYWNANYWFRRVRDPKLTQRILESVAAGTPTAELLTDACEQARVDSATLQNYVTQEWLALFQAACSST